MLSGNKREALDTIIKLFIFVLIEYFCYDENDKG